MLDVALTIGAESNQCARADAGRRRHAAVERLHVADEFVQRHLLELVRDGAPDELLAERVDVGAYAAHGGRVRRLLRLDYFELLEQALRHVRDVVEQEDAVLPASLRRRQHRRRAAGVQRGVQRVYLVQQLLRRASLRGHALVRHGARHFV